MSLLQPLAEQARALAIPPDDLDQIAAAAAEDEHVARERVLLQRLLGLGRQRREPTTHIGHATLNLGKVVRPARLRPDVRQTHIVGHAA